MTVGAKIFVDYQAREDVAGMRVGGMSVVERVLREAARAGAVHAVIRGDDLPPLRPLPLAVETIATSSAPPPGEYATIQGDVIAGVRITDAGSRRAASRALFQTCRRPYDGLGDKYVIRAISTRLTRAMCAIHLTPNFVTSVNIVIGLFACWFAARADLRLAGGLMFVQVVLDSCDGEIARIRYLHSKFGMWLDNTSDDVIDNLFIATLAIGIGGIWMPIGVGGAIARSLTALLIHIDVARAGKPGDVMAFKWWFDSADDELAERFETGTSVLGLLRSIGRRDLYVLVFAATCLAGVPLAGLLVALGICAVYLGLMLIHITRRR